MRIDSCLHVMSLNTVRYLIILTMTIYSYHVSTCSAHVKLLRCDLILSRKKIFRDKQIFCERDIFKAEISEEQNRGKKNINKTCHSVTSAAFTYHVQFVHHTQLAYMVYNMCPNMRVYVSVRAQGSQF